VAVLDDNLALSCEPGTDCR